MTANAMEGDREMYLAAGMDDYVSKPIRVQELVDALKRAAEHKRDHHEEAAPEQAADGYHDYDHEAETAVDEPAFELDDAALQNLRDLAGDDDEFLNELIMTYLHDAPEMIGNMAQAIETGDAPALRMAAHTLKSNSADFGSMALAELAKQLEMIGKEGSVDGADELMPEVHSYFGKTKTTLERMMQKE